jgi:hypothetical protein
MDTMTLERIFQIILSIFALYQLMKLTLYYKELRYISYWGIALVVHILIFASVLVVDNFTSVNIPVTPLLYNEWSSFIRNQGLVSISVVTFLALAKLKRKKS